MKIASRSRFRTSAMALCLFVSATSMLAQAAARTVSGKVLDKGDAPVKGAIVYLKDDHTLAIKSFIADDAGAFRFGQLSSTTDYELWAENAGKKSGVKTVSSFDSKTAFVMNLKLDK